MRIKHWAGYGTVNAKKVTDYHHCRYARKFRVIQIEITGDHERGLCRYDGYDIHHWLGKYFAKDKTYKDLVNYDVQQGWVGGDGYTTQGAHEVAIYTLEYKED